MSATLVHDISQFNLTDVPRRLRMLADELEKRGDAIRACAVIVDFADLPLDIASFGAHGDQLRTIGLLSLAQAYLTHSIIEWDRQESRDPGPVA